MVKSIYFKVLQITPKYELLVHLRTNSSHHRIWRFIFRQAGWRIRFLCLLSFVDEEGCTFFVISKNFCDRTSFVSKIGLDSFYEENELCSVVWFSRLMLLFLVNLMWCEFSFQMRWDFVISFSFSFLTKTICKCFRLSIGLLCRRLYIRCTF